MYKKDEIIQIPTIEYYYSFIYYLSLLLKKQENIVNFSYVIDFIKKIDNDNNSQNNELRKLFVSKIILYLINNFEGIKESDEYNIIIDSMKKKNEKIIDNTNVFKNYNLNFENIKEISLKKLYLDILVELIKNKKLENYDFSNDILTKLDLENIDINHKMFKVLKNILEDEKYICDYKMNSIEDFFKETKINFYYILIKYFFKNSFYIYNIPLLYKIRNTIINIIKTKRKEFLSHFYFENINLFNRFYYNIKFILDSNYYHLLFIDIIFGNIYEETLKNDRKNRKEYINNLNILENIIDKMAIIIYMFKQKRKDMGKAQIEFKDIQKTYKQIEQMIKDKRIDKMGSDDKLILSKYFIDNNNKDSLLKIFCQDSFDFFLNESIKLNQKEKKNKLNQILKYYKTFFFESKKDDINSIEYAISAQGDLDYEINGPVYEKAEILNDRIPLINYLYKINDGNKTELEMQKIIEKYNSLEKNILERNLNTEREVISQLFEYFSDKNNENFLIRIFGKESYEFVLNYYNENTEDSKNVEKNEIIKTKEFYKNNENENNSKIKYQFNSEKEDSSTKFHTTDSKKITICHNYEQKRLCREEKIAYRILKKSEAILNTKKEGNKFVFKYESVRYGDHHILISYEKLLQIKECLNSIESIISESFIKYMEFLKEFKDKLNKEFEQGYKLKIVLEFKIIDETDKDSIFNIDCNYKHYLPNLDTEIFKEENILLKKTNSESFLYFIQSINDNIYKESLEKELNKASDNSSKKNLNNKGNNTSISLDKTNSINLNECSKSEEDYFAQDYQILKIIGIKGEHNTTAEFIIELSNGCFISGGTDNTLKIYDKDILEINEIKNEEWTYSCFEREKEKQNDHEIELITCRNKKFCQIFLSSKNLEEIKDKSQKYEINEIESKNCIQVGENNFAIICHNSSYFKNLFNPQNDSKIFNFSIVPNRSYIGSIKINQNIIALTSNKVQHYGKDKLIFYNIDKNTISKEINKSFTSGINGLAIMTWGETKIKNKILLCACTKYFDDQENGIYLVNLSLEDKQKDKIHFYGTGNFQVFCFCPILNVNPDNDILENGKEKVILDTEYFLVGGFDVDKKEGAIKLYKTIYDEKENNNKIEFLQDIEFERNKDFSGFEGAISCIIQAKKEYNGNILVTCYSGKVYLLTRPNLEYYQKKNNKKAVK